MSDRWKLVVALALPLLVGALSGAATTEGVQSWYPGLEKPAFNPPSWVFGPVWTLLYLMMGFAAFRIWRRAGSTSGVRLALALFCCQLVLNGLWSILFFGLRAPGWAFAEIVALWLAIVATIWSFRRVEAASVWWLLPYLAWVSFAAVLNYSLWTLNS